MQVRKEIQISSLLASMPEGVLIVGRRGSILQANHAAERFTGRPESELVGMNITELARHTQVTGDSGPVEFPHLVATRALRGEVVRNERRTFRAGNGDPVETLVSASPIHDTGERIVGALVVIRDITELTELQRRLNDTERHTAVGHMAAGIAHDFNNVLDTIEKAIVLLEMRQNASPQQRLSYLQAMHNAVHRGAEIIARLRQYLRTGTTDLAPVDVRKLLEETLELTEPIWKQASGVTVTRDLLPVPQVRGNASDLRRVFTNLIINALEAMPRGGELTVVCGPQNGHVRVRVRDTGIGIPPEEQKKIFYPYFTTKASGTGLGLSGAQRIVLSYGGNIRLHSEPGKGTEFTVELPAIQNGNIRPIREPSGDRDNNGGRKAA